MIKSYEQFKSKIFSHKDQILEILNLLYYVDKLKPIIDNAYVVIDQVEQEKEKQKITQSLLHKRKEKVYKGPEDETDFALFAIYYSLVLLRAEEGPWIN
jgi:hypothetical protein